MSRQATSEPTQVLPVEMRDPIPGDHVIYSTMSQVNLRLSNDGKHLTFWKDLMHGIVVAVDESNVTILWTQRKTSDPVVKVMKRDAFERVQKQVVTEKWGIAIVTQGGNDERNYQDEEVTRLVQVEG